MVGSMLLMAQQPDDTMKQIDLLGRLLMPLALRLQELVAGRAVIDAQWLKAGLAVITLPVVVWAGGQFYRGAWSGFKHRTADMNTLIGVGTGAAYLYSLAATVAPVAFTGDRKSTRLNSSHVRISYAVFCLEKKKETIPIPPINSPPPPL